jgi:Flp pilus assembly protein CpaB
MGRRAIVLLVALILAGLAAWAVWQYLQGVEREAQVGQTQVQVYRAGPGGIAEGADGSVLLSGFQSAARCQDATTGMDAAQGCPIKASTDLQGNVPVGYIDTVEKLRATLQGRVAAGPIAEGAVLTETGWVVISTQTKPLSEQIPSGKQALTISTGNVQGVNGFIRAGDRLNMIVTLDILFSDIPVGQQIPTLPGEGETDTETEDVTVTYTRYVLQGIPVLAVGQDVRVEETDDLTGQIPATPPGEEAAEVPPTIFTLEVTPEQAERIVYAFENGSIWLTLVPLDFVEVETNGVIIDNLFGGDLVESIFGN